MRVAGYFNCGVDGALRHLGYPPPSPRELARITYWVTDVAMAEDLYRRWQNQDKDKGPDITPEEGKWFEEFTLLASACEGCWQMPGQRHLDGCPLDTGE